MASEVEWSLRCDGKACTASLSMRGVHDEVAQRKLFRLARELGWRCNELGDFCPKHQAPDELQLEARSER